MLVYVGCILALWVLYNVYTFYHTQPSVNGQKVNRIGINPGFSKLTVWPARIDFLNNGHRRVRELYEKSDDFNVRIQTALCDQVLLGPKYLEELRHLPETRLNATAALVESVFGKYNGVDILSKGHLGGDISRGQLTKHLPGLIPNMQEELKIALKTFLEKERKDQDLYNAYNLVNVLIKRICSRVFIGRPYCYDPIWTKAVETFPENVYKTVSVLLPLPSFLQGIAIWLLPAKWNLIRDHTSVRNFLFPRSSLDQEREQLTVYEFMVHSGKDKDPDTLTSRLILLTAAAHENSSFAITQMIYDLCARPDYMKILREEIQTSYVEHGHQWTMAALDDLRLLDSFMKESQRMNVSDYLGFNRKVMSDIELSDGTILKTGTTICMAGGPMAQDERYYKDAKTFDPRRFITSMKSESSAYTDIEEGNLSWGYGRFQCPGRWYASAMIKLIIANLLLQYDLKFPQGQITRPINRQRDTSVVPDIEQMIHVSIIPEI